MVRRMQCLVFWIIVIPKWLLDILERPEIRLHRRPKWLLTGISFYLLQVQLLPKKRRQVVNVTRELPVSCNNNSTLVWCALPLPTPTHSVNLRHSFHRWCHLKVEYFIHHCCNCVLFQKCGKITCRHGLMSWFCQW